MCINYLQRCWYLTNTKMPQYSQCCEDLKDGSRKVKKDISWGKSIGLGNILDVTKRKEYKRSQSSDPLRRREAIAMRETEGRGREM